MKQGQFTKDQISFIDRLRAAAKEHGAVAELLELMDESIEIVNGNELKFVGDEEMLGWLEAAMLASKFATADREPS